MIRLEDQLTVCVYGTIYDTTSIAVQNYLENSRISRVVFSTWTDIFPLAHPKLTVVYNQVPKKLGIDNRNLKIISSYFGLIVSQTKYSWNICSDQILDQSCINTYLDFFEDQFNEKDPKIFTSDICTKELFNIRDNSLISTTKKLVEFWQCPLDEWIGPTDYNQCIRTEAYIVCNYLKRYSTAAFTALMEPKKYLLDNSPERTLMLERSNQVMPKYFVAIPIVTSEHWSNNGN